MRTRSLSALTALLLGVGAAACAGDILANETNLEGVGGGLPGLPPGYHPTTLIFHGLVTSAATGERVSDVTVRIEAPARGWTATVVTDSAAGYYTANGLPNPSAGACTGLSIAFSREGYQRLRVVDFPLLRCEVGFSWLSVSLAPSP